MGDKMIFDIEQFYNKAEAGEETDLDGFKNYLESFRYVIIWGAGNLGTALGKGFIDQKIKVDGYWDKNFAEIGERNGLPVEEPFSDGRAPEETLVIIGIVNGTLSHTWQKGMLESKGYHHYLLGMYVYEAVVCPLRKGMTYDAKLCTSTSVCNFNTCKKYLNVLKGKKQKTGLTVHVLEFIVSSRCTLDCKYCGQQAGDTKRRFPEKYRDYPAEEIMRSADLVMDRLDAVGTFSVIGGEPFIHPQIREILKHFLSKENVGIISITSNGIFKLDDELLEVLKDKRIKINFSNYTYFLDEKKKALYDENVTKLEVAGISCNTGTPIWGIVNDELRDDPDFSDETLDSRKTACVFGPSIAGRYMYACPSTERYARMEIHDVSDDVIELQDDNEGLTEKIRDMINKKHYIACGFTCTNSKGGPIIPAGEQWVE